MVSPKILQHIQEAHPPFPLQQIEQPSTTPEQGSKTLPTTTQVNVTPLQQSKPNLIKHEEEPTDVNPSDKLL